jgi:hypothetical protein
MISSNVVDTVRIILIFCGSPIITRLAFSALTAERHGPCSQSQGAPSRSSFWDAMVRSRGRVTLVP